VRCVRNARRRIAERREHLLSGVDETQKAEVFAQVAAEFAAVDALTHTAQDSILQLDLVHVLSEEAFDKCADHLALLAAFIK